MRAKAGARGGGMVAGYPPVCGHLYQRSSLEKFPVFLLPGLDLSFSEVIFRKILWKASHGRLVPHRYGNGVSVLH